MLELKQIGTSLEQLACSIALVTVYEHKLWMWSSVSERRSLDFAVCGNFKISKISQRDLIELPVGFGNLNRSSRTAGEAISYIMHDAS